MNINFKWVSTDSYEKNDLNKYCDSSKSAEFCWWVSNDLTNDNKSYKDIINIINLAETGSTNEWRGNSHRLLVTPKGVTLSAPRNNISYDYTLTEFKESMKGWYHAANSSDK